MKASTVSVVDYGGSNLLSVVRALQHCDADIVLAQDAQAIRSAERLVLPGVGAFGNVRQALASRGMIQSIGEFATNGRPFLGICVGMQLMMDYSEEFGRNDGFGMVPGTVTAIPRNGADGMRHPIPHIGWASLDVPSARDATAWTGTILDGIKPGSAVYFVHSFAANPANPADRLADVDYDGICVSAAIRHDSLFGCQFHPEKSGPVGLAVIRNFLSI